MIPIERQIYLVRSTKMEKGQKKNLPPKKKNFLLTSLIAVNRQYPVTYYNNPQHAKFSWNLSIHSYGFVEDSFTPFQTRKYTQTRPYWESIGSLYLAQIHTPIQSDTYRNTHAVMWNWKHTQQPTLFSFYFSFVGYFFRIFFTRLLSASWIH